MSEDKKKEGKEKDLTGIFDLPSLDSSDPASNVPEDPFAVNVMAPVEQIDTFESIDQIGMIDHPAEVPADPAIEASVELPVESTEETPSAPPVEPFAFQNDFAPTPSETQEITSLDPFMQPPTSENTEVEIAPIPNSSLEEIKNYSEKTRAVPFEAGARVPFTLLINGIFDPYSRDKLLLFITENPIGLNSADLDLQINGNRVLLPRISEFAGIKLIQDLRDTGLRFKLLPSDQDDDEASPPVKTSTFQFSSQNQPSQKGDEIPVLPETSVNSSHWKVIDSIEMVQYLRADLLEVEKSELYQNLIDRMIEAMKRKARIKGADAITSLTRELKPLRLPSQYQVELRATLIKKQ